MPVRKDYGTQSTSAQSDTRCQWESTSGRCRLSYGIQDGSKRYCLWHHLCWSTSHDGTDYEAFTRWLGMSHFAVYRRNWEQNRGGQICLWVRYEAEDLWSLVCGLHVAPRERPRDDQAMSKESMEWRLENSPMPSSLKKRMRDVIAGKRIDIVDAATSGKRRR